MNKWISGLLIALVVFVVFITTFDLVVLRLKRKNVLNGNKFSRYLGNILKIV